MFLDLINLYHKYQKGSITPLEDFNTEIFANLLVMYPEILNAFLYQFFSLESLEKLKINTQQRERITGDRADCIVDLVISSEKYIIFIENKVESHEGDEQLDRYAQALLDNHKCKKRLLVYCTKYADPKEPSDPSSSDQFFKLFKKELKNDTTSNTSDLRFIQFRWYEVAKFLQPFMDNAIVKAYLEFLTNYKMNQDNTLKPEHLITFENMSKSIEIAEFHIENVKPEFITKFGYERTDKNANWDQIRGHQRFCYYKFNIFSSQSGKWSEVLYAVSFVELKLIAQIYVDQNHEDFQKVFNADCSGLFEKSTLENLGVVIRLDEDLGKYLNKPEADKDIKEWFLESFDRLEKLIQLINES